MSFKDLKLNRPILRAIAEMNYDEPTPVQEMTIPLVLEKKILLSQHKQERGRQLLLPCLFYSNYLTDKMPPTKRRQ